MTNSPFQPGPLQPLLTQDQGPAPTARKRPRAERPARRPLKDRWKALVAAQTDTPSRAKRFRLLTISTSSLALAALGLSLFLALRPYPQPDYEDDPLDEVFNFTLFKNEFNNLPLEERVRLVGSLVARVEGMGGSDGTLLAAFAAGIAGSAREQLEENAAQLMLDFMDHFAKDYPALTDPAAQEDLIKQKIIDMTRLAEELDGNPTDKSDDEILTEAFAQAERDQQAMRDPARGPSLAGVSRMADMMENRIGAKGTPHQKARITRLMRDMTRYLRNQDITTGKPKPGG